VLAMAFAGVAVILWRVCQRIRTGPPPFNQTIAQFRKDRFKSLPFKQPSNQILKTLGD